MRVIFLQDVPRIGRKFEAKDVADGFARNFLLPRKLAVLRTNAVEKQYAADHVRSETSRALEKQLFVQNFRALDGATIDLSARANVHGHLFAGVGQEEIVAAIAAAHRIEIPPGLIPLEKPIKEIGEHKLTVKSSDVEAHFVLSVKALE